MSEIRPFFVFYRRRGGRRWLAGGSWRTWDDACAEASRLFDLCPAIEYEVRTDYSRGLKAKLAAANNAEVQP